MIENCFKQRTGNSKDDWETPQYFYDLLNREFHFTLDPCASEANHKCSKYFTEIQNGLREDWQNERVFVNPPFNNKAQWIKKCYFEGLRPNSCVVLIIPTTSDTEAWHQYVMHADEIRFCVGRVNFLHPNAEKRNAPTFPLSVVVFRTPRIFDHLHISSFFHKEKGVSIR